MIKNVVDITTQITSQSSTLISSNIVLVLFLPFLRYIDSLDICRDR